MLYRIAMSVILVLVLGVVGVLLDGGNTSSTSTAAPASAAGPDDSAMKSLKIE